jgi:hypothetical protein
VLRWARAIGCPWNNDTWMMAAHHGRLEALRWAIENGLPCDRENWQLCMSVAQMNGHLDMLTWLNENQALSR